MQCGSIKKCWDGERVFIIGGGDSLRNFDWSLLDDKPCIAVNTAFLFQRNAECIFFTESMFYRQWNSRFHKSQAKYIYTVDSIGASAFEGHTPDKRLTVLKNAKSAWSMQKRAIGSVGNSGLRAINLAWLMGAGEIVLLGFDANPDGERNWHSGTNFAHNRTTDGLAMSQRSIEASEKIRLEMLKKGIDPLIVRNAYADSHIKAFKSIDLNFVA